MERDAKIPKVSHIRWEVRRGGEIAPRGGQGGGGYEPPFPTPPPPRGGVGSSVGGPISANMALVVVVMFKDTLVPSHFWLFSVTVPHQGLPLPSNGKSSLLKVCVC